jgi:DNA-binding transcriptional ArsR family regulator
MAVRERHRERIPDEQLNRTFAALADPTRRDMVARLTAADATVGELAEPYGMSMQAISKHVAVLQDAGLVTKTKAAQRRMVHLDLAALDPLTSLLERYRRDAEARYRRLDALLAELNDHDTKKPTTGGETP